MRVVYWAGSSRVHEVFNISQEKKRNTNFQLFLFCFYFVSTIHSVFPHAKSMVFLKKSTSFFLLHAQSTHTSYPTLPPLQISSYIDIMYTHSLTGPLIFHFFYFFWLENLNHTHYWPSDCCSRVTITTTAISAAVS